MNEASNKQPRLQYRFSLLTGTLLIVLATGVLFVLFETLRPDYTPRYRQLRCLGNLKQLGMMLTLYAHENRDMYPPVQRWSDVLVAEYGQEDDVNDILHCRGDETGPCSYAMNPNADANGANDVVLLFESQPGWNQYGGPELLEVGNHEGRGCNVLFVDGNVEFIKTEDVAGLKWRGEDMLSAELGNARRPANDEELKYWLENMIGYHRFSTEEVRAATGLAVDEIAAAQERFGIGLGERPERPADAPLLVLPYPGGRHPRIGFLEGAIDPQRETKFSVFTPWDANSYAVLDIPEAIWSNLGLTYLAHTHIDTIWTSQGIDLPKLEWTRRSDGGLEVERTLPNGLAFGVEVRPTREAVHMAMWLRNGTTERLTDLRVQNCVMPKMAAGFASQINDNKVFTNPYVACRSDEGRRWIITAWESCQRPWGNEDCPCFHSDPKFPDLEPGQEHRLRGWLSFYEGDDVEAEFRRIEATGWRQN